MLHENIYRILKCPRFILKENFMIVISPLGDLRLISIVKLYYANKLFYILRVKPRIADELKL